MSVLVARLVPEAGGVAIDIPKPRSDWDHQGRLVPEALVPIRVSLEGIVET